MSIALILTSIGAVYFFGMFVTFYFLVRFDALKGPYDDNFARYCSSIFWPFAGPVLAFIGVFKAIESIGETRRSSVIRKRKGR
jgi:amino acid transporter